MDDELQSRWRRADAPGGVSLGTLHRALRLVAAELRPLVASELCINEDWHDHDGFLHPSRPFSWEALDAWTASEEQLAEHKHGDFAVHWTVHDLDYRFLLRFYLDDERPVSECDLDLCAADPVLVAVSARLAEAGIATRLARAKDYFDQRYGR